MQLAGWRLWYMVAVLCSTNAVAFIDRASLPLLAQQIERDLHISDQQMGLLQGAAFVIPYFAIAIPAGILIDRFPRRQVMALGIFFWAGCTMLCGFAFSFGGLFLGRLGIGTAEAVCPPGSVSIIRDGVPRDKRGRAVGIWAMGANIGGAIALLAGGAILLAIGDRPSVVLPLLGTIRSWQLVLICCGLLALPVAGLMFSFPEPRRLASRDGTSMAAALGYVRSRWTVFLPLFLVNGLTIIMTVGGGLWEPLMMGRVFHLSRPEIGFTLGVMMLTLAMPSQLLAGVIMDWLERRGIANPIPRFGAIIAAISLPLGIGFPLAATANVAWLLLGGWFLVATATFTIGTALIARLAPPDMVGRVTSLHFLWVGLCGTLIGGQLFPAVAAGFFAHAGERAIADALSSVIGVLDLAALLTYGVLMMTTRAEAARPGAAALPG